MVLKGRGAVRPQAEAGEKEKGLARELCMAFLVVGREEGKVHFSLK